MSFFGSKKTETSRCVKCTWCKKSLPGYSVEYNTDGYVNSMDGDPFCNKRCYQQYLSSPLL